jgi:hypothetical protein
MRDMNDIKVSKTDKPAVDSGQVNEVDLADGVTPRIWTPGGSFVQTDHKQVLVQTLLGRNDALHLEDSRQLRNAAEGPGRIGVEDALNAIGRLGDSSLPVITTVSQHVLISDDRTHLTAALKALNTLNSDVATVLGCVKTYDGPISSQMQALELLSEVDKEAAIYRALEMVNSTDPNLQSDALMTLNAISPEDALRVAAAILERREGSDLLRETAFFVVSFGSPEMAAIDAGRTPELGATRDQVSMSLTAMHGTEPGERVVAMGWLKNATPDLACCIMADRLRDRDSGVRLEALKGLKQIDSTTAALFAPVVLNDRDSNVATLARDLLT